MTDASSWALDRAGDQAAAPGDDWSLMLIDPDQGDAPTTRRFAALAADIAARGVTAGRIERASGHDLPADAAVEWDAGTVPPVLLLSPLTLPFPIAPGAVVGLAVTATGGGGGTAPQLTVDLRGPDGTVISTSDVLRADGTEEYLLLDITAAAASGRLNLEGVSGTDSGAYDVRVSDILGFSGASRAAQLIALIGSRIIRLEDTMGITQAEAAALIAQLVPPERRIPSLAGHGGDLVAVNAAGGSVVLADPDAVVAATQTQADLTALDGRVLAAADRAGWHIDPVPDGSTRVAAGRRHTGACVIIVDWHAHNPTQAEQTIHLEVKDTTQPHETIIRTVAVPLPAGATEQGQQLTYYTAADRPFALDVRQAGGSACILYGTMATVELP